MKTILILGFLVISLPSYNQCEILNRLFPDGTMLYYMEPVNFYWTSAKSLKGCMVSDKENYFLELRPVPFPEKPLGNKLKEDLELILGDGITYDLKHYDTRYTENDTVMEMLFLIEQEDIEKVLEFEAIEVKIDMKGEEGIRSYKFKLHKSALKEQLSCFLNEEKEMKKK
jgi:hypothetical protein